jgi:threonine/homoserine/homoserine lactone efflux protein
MCSGVSVHTTAAAFGISALFYSSAVAFNLVKYAGALYLLFLAWKTLSHPSKPSLDLTSTQPATELFRRGFIMNVLNPKVALFFLAFLPQFVSPAAGYLPLQMLLLGSIFMLQAVFIFALIGWFSGNLGNYLLSKPETSRKFDWLTAIVLALLGVRLALAER